MRCDIGCDHQKFVYIDLQKPGKHSYINVILYLNKIKVNFAIAIDQQSVRAAPWTLHESHYPVSLLHGSAGPE